MFDKNVARIGHEETRRLLLRDNDPARPAPEETFQDRRTLEIGGERIDLAWYGSNHSPDNIYIHLPDHDTLMLVDIVNPGWAPVYIANLTEDIPGYIEAPANALAYPWKHFIGGHLGRLGTRDDVTLHQQYMADIAASVRTGARHGRSDALLREVRREHLGRGEGLPRRRAPTPPPRPSSRSTPASSPPPTCSPPARPSGSWSRSASTSATAPRFIPERASAIRSPTI